MKFVSETKGIEKLAKISDEFAAEIRENYEIKARSCSSCSSPGVCCRDEHFVNVRITRLEAAAIAKRLVELGEARKTVVYNRINETIEKFHLTAEGDTFRQTYACPLFEKGVGCLVHYTAKPLPCIAHACYERKEDVPPERLLLEREQTVGALNRKVFGKELPPLPLPVALVRHSIS